MKIELKPNWEVRSKTRTKEFAKAVQYLLENFPPSKKELKFLDVLFVKGEYVSFSANGDYTSYDNDTYLDANIRVAYGKDGWWKRDKVLHYLFHEYKHLLQDDSGSFTEGKSNCQEADEWAAVQVPIYLDHLRSQK